MVDRCPPARAGKLSPFQLYQFLLGSVPDADVFRFLRQLTFLPLAELGALEAAAGSAAYAPNTAQRLLAAEVTRFVHGPDGLAAALAATAVRSPRRKPACDPHSGRRPVYPATAGSARRRP